MYSDEYESHDDASSSDDGSDESLCNGRRFIDSEAEESGEGSSEGSDEESSYASESLNGGDSPTDVPFPQFMRLPPELRYRVWHFYCPDLSARARVLQFAVSPSSAIMKRPDHYSVHDHFTLADHTESLRVMLSTHRESRSIATFKYPDELHMDVGYGDAIVRCRKETDVIILEAFRMDKEYVLPDFADMVQNLAIVPLRKVDREWIEEMPRDTIFMMKKMFPNLKRLFSHVPADRQTTAKSLRWCATNFVHAYMVETSQKSPGLGEDVVSLFCWPDVDRHRDFANHSVPKPVPRELETIWNVERWPIVEFEREYGIALYDDLRRLGLFPERGYLFTRYGRGDSEDDNDDDDDDDTEDGTDLDEYESEGIDDEEIIDVGSSSEDELLPGEVGRFSSPESDDAQAAGEADTMPPQRSCKRNAIVVDSDDDDEMEGQRDDNLDDENGRRRKRARQSRLVLDSDDEEERDEGPHQDDESEVEIVSKRRVPNSARATLICSDDDEDDDDTQGGAAILESDSSEEDEQDEDVMPTKFSLAERLRRVRNENPVSSASEGSGQTDEDSGRDTSDDEEDDEDDEEEDEDRDEDGLLDTMAGDETEEEEDEDEDAW
ncbi:hypothetical protein E4U43_002567 [Claviceps pusilla]|uniref:2EXR domain-containing protein n=1 Tax=Claviceps pusilla TaxID=123648 RepID=A0A9P7N8P5_9HYPO|nr:hypothetical protein E4U43_002567 [Claviceps pusilla]